MDIGQETEVVTFEPVVEPLPARPRPASEPRRAIPNVAHLPIREHEPRLR